MGLKSERWKQHIRQPKFFKRSYKVSHNPGLQYIISILGMLCLALPARCKKLKLDFQSEFSMSKIIRIFLKKNLLKIIHLRAHFLFLLILCSTKIERLLFLKFLKNLAFFYSYFWPFNKSEEKIKVIFVTSVIMPSI